MFVEYTSSNQKPGVHLDAKAGTHQPPLLGKAVGYDQVEQRSDMMLYNNARGFDAVGHHDDPNQIGEEVTDRYGIKKWEPLSRPCLLQSLLALQIEKYIPIPNSEIQGCES